MSGSRQYPDMTLYRGNKRDFMPATPKPGIIDGVAAQRAKLIRGSVLDESLVAVPDTSATLPNDGRPHFKLITRAATKGIPMANPELVNADGMLPPGQHTKVLRSMARQLSKSDLEAEIESAHEALNRAEVPQAKQEGSRLTTYTLPQRIDALAAQAIASEAAVRMFRAECIERLKQQGVYPELAQHLRDTLHLLGLVLNDGALTDTATPDQVALRLGTPITMEEVRALTKAGIATRTTLGSQIRLEAYAAASDGVWHTA